MTPSEKPTFVERSAVAQIPNADVVGSELAFMFQGRYVVDGGSPIHHSRFMDISRATIIMSALAQTTRLRTYKLLLEAGDEGLASGAVAALVGAPQNTISSHLTILTYARLFRRQQEGRVVCYRAVRDEVDQIGPLLTN